MACPVKLPEGFTRWKPRKQGDKGELPKVKNYAAKLSVIFGDGSVYSTLSVDSWTQGCSNWTTQVDKENRIYGYKEL